VRFSAPRTGGPDGLTRTTLQIDGTMSPPSVAQVLEALQRVPGVLLAEVNPQNARAVVAHDAAVPAASLLAAATRAGVHAAIVAGVRAPADSVGTALQVQHARLRRFATVALAVFVTLVLDATVPNIAARQWIVPIVVLLLWILFAVDAVIDRLP
jgi:hypothetical protein